MYVGIDVGTKNVGWATVRENGEIADSGSDTFKGTLEERFEDLVMWGNSGFSSFEPGTTVGLECPWVGNNIQTALKLGEAKGIIRCMALWKGLLVVDISPAEAKKALTGKGNATKEDMLRVAQGLRPEVETHDEADAIGVALAAWEQSGGATI